MVDAQREHTMRTSNVRLFAVALLALVSAGCASDPLVGTWVNSVTGAEGRTTSLTLELQDSGAALGSLVVTGPGCTGSLRYAGANWTANDANITFTGTASCSGSVVCTGGTAVNIACGSMIPISGVRPYSLLNDNNTLIMQLISYRRAN